MRFTIDIRARPIRTAFFVPPNNPHAVRRAISINSFVWGGHLNPILPLFRRTPKHWQDELPPNPSAREVLRGYVDAFDPDFVTYLSCESSQFPCDEFRTEVRPDDVLGDFTSSGSARMGIGYFELARRVGHEEMRFARRTPLHFVAPSVEPQHHAFLASVVGELPEEIADDIRFQLRQAYESPDIEASLETYGDCLDPSYVTPLRLVRHHLRPDRYVAAWKRNYIFYMDATNLLDVIDFWNLRALGFTVLAVPMQAANQEKVLAAAKRFIVDNHSVSRHDPAVTFNVRILRARSISKSVFEGFVESWAALQDVRDTPARPLVQPWFPRLWDRWSREHNECDCVRFFCDSSDQEVVTEDNWIRFRPLVPDFADGSGGGFSVANELSLRTYSSDEPMAEVFPQAKGTLGAPFGTYTFRDEWRFSATGPVHFPRLRTSTSIGVPQAQRVVEQWFVCDGWKVTTSQAGLACQELLKHLGGVHLTSRIADEDTVALLGELSTGRPISSKRLRGKAWQIANNRGFDSPDGIISTLIESRLVALGIRVKCSTCGRHPWYELSSIRSIVECTECLRELELPVYAPDKIEWAYRGTGPLISLSTSTGAFPVLLTLRFFTTLLRLHTTPALGVTLERNGDEYELDLGGFVLESEFARSRTRLVFAECKTFNKFEKGDITRLEKLGSLYPGAMLVFSTLRSSLETQEVKSLVKLAEQGRRKVGAEEPVNPVMILTGPELFARHDLTSHWESLGGKHATLSGQLRRDSDLLALCSITQQLYLNMSPMSLPV